MARQPSTQRAARRMMTVVLSGSSHHTPAARMQVTALRETEKAAHFLRFHGSAGISRVRRYEERATYVDVSWVRKEAMKRL